METAIARRAFHYRTLMMSLRTLIDGVKGFNLAAAQLAIRRPGRIRGYVIDTDANLVAHRHPAEFIYRLRLETRCRLLACSSLDFDPSPYAGTVELGFIDGAHALSFVTNDTRKMATMIAQAHPDLSNWRNLAGVDVRRLSAGAFDVMTELDLPGAQLQAG